MMILREGTLLVLVTILISWVSSVYSLKIDNKVSITKKDCYERQAIGHRLSPKDVYRNVSAKSVEECQDICTGEHDKCRTFSFGVGVKGNTTCELSVHVIKETSDLKPIGTVNDTSFDLYTKKLGCKLVIENPIATPYNTPDKKTGEINRNDTKVNTTTEKSGGNNSEIHDSDFMKRPDENKDEDHYLRPRPPGDYYLPVKPLNMRNQNPHFRPTLRDPSFKPSFYPRNNPYHSRKSYENIFKTSTKVSSGTISVRPEPFGNNNVLPNFNETRNYEFNMGNSNSHTMMDYERHDRINSYNYEIHHNYQQPTTNLEGGNRFNYRELETNRNNLGIRPDYSNRGGYTSYDYAPTYGRERDGYRKPCCDEGKDIRLNFVRPYSNNDENVIRRKSFSYWQPNEPLNAPKSYFSGEQRILPNPYLRSYNYEIRDASDFYATNRGRYLPFHNKNHNHYDGSSSVEKESSNWHNDNQNYNHFYGNSNSNDFKPNNINRNENVMMDSKNQQQEETMKNVKDAKDNVQSRTQLGKRNSSETVRDGYRIISTTLGPNGEAIISVITEMLHACYRRVLAGKRITPSFVRKAVFCERLEDCMKECAEESQFVCEGFNYRLDQSGKGQGDCELLDLPLQEINLRRDIVHDPDYDYYERDRNVGPDCKTYPTQRPTYSTYDRPPARQYRPPPDSRGGYDFPRRRNYGGSYYGKDDRNVYYDERRYRPPSYYGQDDGYRYDPPPSYGGGQRGDKSYDFYDHRFNVEGHSSYNFSGEDRFNHDSGRFFHHTARVPSYLPTGGVDASRKELQPPPTLPTTYLPERPATPDVTTPRYEPSPVTPSYQSDKGRFYPGDDRRQLLPPPPPQLYHKRPFYHLPDNRKSYLPHGEPPVYDYKSYEPFLPPEIDYYQKDFFWDNYFRNREQDLRYWGFGDKKSYWGGSYGNFGKHNGYFTNVPQKPFVWDDHYQNDKTLQPFVPAFKPKEWNAYGGLYGYGGQKSYYDHHKDSYNYWGLRKYDDQQYFSNFFIQPPKYKPVPPTGNEYFFGPTTGFEPGFFGSDSLVKKACSLRMTSGFRLHRHAVRKFLAVKDIYECELHCFKEKTFICSSYAFRYTYGPSVPPENCYLSDKTYKTIDYYVDLEPDRNFDLYTMNNREVCHNLLISSRGYSECFWRVRSGLRFDHGVVKDSLTCQTLPECQLECLHSKRFTCRAFSYRFGPSIPGGSIDNCQLSDVPFFELNSRVDLKPEPGFEIYERGSYGHGCEPFHFKIGSANRNITSSNMNELCYVGYGTPAKILPIATKSSVQVENDFECRQKCTEAREKLLFECMSYSFRSNVSPNSPNCDLSDIYQSDLLPNIDYVIDKDSLLYAWNDYDPECVALLNSKGGHIGNNDNDISIPSTGVAYPPYTWRMFSVNGWPCKSLSRQNKEAGFWFCEIEGASPNSWDYCCRPDHQCGYSEGYSYQWCYVGNQKTQWRQCNDKYYPYAKNIIIRLPNHVRESYLPDLKPLHTNLIANIQHSYNPRFRPNRPQVHKTTPYKSLDEYEKEFDNQFLEKPTNNLGEPKNWPVSYLHKEMPPKEGTTNSSEPEDRSNPTSKEQTFNSKYEAISNLIDVIKKEEFENIKYEIENQTNTSDNEEVLVVQIPLPSNFTKKSENLSLTINNTKKFEYAEPVYVSKIERIAKDTKAAYSKSYITKTSKPEQKNEHN